MQIPPRTRQDLLRYLAEGTAGVVGDAFLRSLVTHLAAAFGADAAFVAELIGDGRARTLAAFAVPEIHLPEGHEFDLDGTPEGYVAVALTGSGGAPIGHMGVMARRGLEASPDELAVMRIFASRAAAEIERRRQAADLAGQRARVIEAADEERRRIGRDLHDGAQQRLVALGQYIDLARRKAEGDPAEADRLLGLAREQATLAGAELRDLVRGLHPVALERGLGVALASLAMQDALELKVEALPERRLPSVVEATVWFVVSEGLTNAVKHAGATELRVRVEERGDSVRMTVADDGAGGARPEAGTGLLGLAARIEALGGAFAVDSPAGAGTRLEATIPIG
jgi:signal transduction histidine kinase